MFQRSPKGQDLKSITGIAHTRSKKNRIMILNNIKTEVNFKRHIPSILGAGSKPHVLKPAQALAQGFQPRKPHGSVMVIYNFLAVVVKKLRFLNNSNNVLQKLQFLNKFR
jgi:hypothetical protein